MLRDFKVIAPGVVQCKCGAGHLDEALAEALGYTKSHKVIMVQFTFQSSVIQVTRASNIRKISTRFGKYREIEIIFGP